MNNENDIHTIYNPRSNTRINPNSVTNKEAQLVRTTSRDGSYHNVESNYVSHDDNKERVAKKSISIKANLYKLWRACFSASAKKIYCGVWVTVCITASWVAGTHFIKYLFHSYSIISMYNTSDIPPHLEHLSSSDGLSPTEIFCDSIRNFRNNNFTAGRFLIRCSSFCVLWVLTNYMYVNSLRFLLATDVIALFATNVAYVYLLSWVILHEQFVGLRIVAIILCNTGVALLAYMDGTAKNYTLKNVLLATSAAASFAIYKVLFKKTFGNVTLGQLSLFFSLTGMLNATLLWPVCLILYFTDVEILQWDKLPWSILFGASFFFLITHLLGNFSVAVTYDLFITLGLITSVPVSAALDIVLYGTNFYGMKLAGIILISVGFFLVMFPNDWPDYITRLLRWNRKNRGPQLASQRTDPDFRTGLIRSNLRSPSGRVK
ncbi:hypothetical protein PGB90_001702 [Kerria lacca]